MEIAKDFYAKKSGYITGLWERSLMYAANPIMYIVYTVQAMHRMDILFSDAGCSQFSTTNWNKSFKKMSDRLASEEIFQNIDVDSNGYKFVSKSDDP